MSERLTEAELVRLDALIERGVRFQPASVYELVAEIRTSWQERDQWKRATEVWQRCYQELVMEPMPRLLWRRLVVRFARLMGRRR